MTASEDAVHADPVAEALRTWLRTCTRSGWNGELGAETVLIREACGRVTDEPVRARWNVPAYRASAMDGIAVTTAAFPHPGDGAVHEPGADMARAPRPVLGPADFDQVDTGDPVPQGRDAVIIREHVTVTASGCATIDLTEPPRPGRHIRPVGEDVALGVMVLPAGHRIRPVDAAAVAAAGHLDVSVRRRPVVAIVPTGDEIRPLGAALASGRILDTNSMMLAGIAEDLGCEALVLPIVPDDRQLLAAALSDAAHRAHLVLVIAGSGAGRGDHTSAVVERLGSVAVHGVAMRPGHPVVLGVLGGNVSSGPGTPAVPVVGVPGYPASAERAFDCFARPLLRRMLGTGSVAGNPGIPARLAEPLTSAEHVDEQLRVRLARVVHPRTGWDTLVAVPLPRGAGALTTLVQAEAVLRVPAGTATMAAGADIRLAPVEGAAFSAETTIVTGVRSPATEAFMERHQADRPSCTARWIISPAHDAVEALAEGLCHAAAIAVQITRSRPDPEAISAIAARIGPVTVLEIARLTDLAEVLVVPAIAFDSPAVEELRTTLCSMAFRHRLRACSGYTGRCTGHETWHGSRDPHGEERRRSWTTAEAAAGRSGGEPHADSHDDRDGAFRCASR